MVLEIDCIQKKISMAHIHLSNVYAGEKILFPVAGLNYHRYTLT